VFRENRRSASSLAVAGVCSIVCVKFIIEVGPKVNESIKDPLQVKVWLRVIVKGVATAIGSVSTSAL
jgi:hypothetical protein